MKKNVLLLALLLGAFGISNANSINENNLTTNNQTSRYGQMEPFRFIERGVEFYVFPNGEFDFNTHPEYRRTPRMHTSINNSYGAPAYNSHSNHGVTIEHDHLGRVRRIGNVFVNYDAFNRIKRVGSVYMNYNCNLIRNIGGLHVFYDRHLRIIRTSGYIKYNLGCHFCGSHSCSTNHYSSSNHAHNNGHGYNNNGNWDNDNLYYRNSAKKNKKTKR
jgi:hypothetical protein